MTVTEDLASFLADFGEAGTLAGSAVTVIMDSETVDADGALTQQPNALLTSAAAAAAAAGQAFVAGGVTYAVRQVLREPPDGAFTRLLLVRA